MQWMKRKESKWEKKEKNWENDDHSKVEVLSIYLFFGENFVLLTLLWVQNDNKMDQQ